MASDYLAAAADDLLAALMAGLAEATTGRPPPSVSYVAHGAPVQAYCCDDGYAAVYADPLQTVLHDQQGAFDAACAIIPEVTFVLEWGRCVPGVDDSGWPDPADLTVSAQDLLEDLWCVLTELYDRVTHDAIAGAACSDIRLGAASALEPSGGCAGWQVRVTMTCNDAGPTGS